MRSLLLILILASCGGGDTVIEKQVSPTPQTPSEPIPPGSTKISYTQMQGYLSKYCVQCHSTAPFMQNEAELRRSRAKAELSSKSMPPPNGPTVPEGDRTLMVNFF